VISYSLVEKFIQIAAAYITNYKRKHIKLNVSISYMECYIVTILAPYTTIQCQISTWTVAFYIYCYNLVDKDSTLFLYKSRGRVEKVY
jgi:hypothetical protein